MPALRGFLCYATRQPLRRWAINPSGDLLDRLGHHAAGIIRTFRPQATSNALWAFAKLAYVPCEPFLAAAALQVPSVLFAS